MFPLAVMSLVESFCENMEHFWDAGPILGHRSRESCFHVPEQQLSCWLGSSDSQIFSRSDVVVNRLFEIEFRSMFLNPQEFEKYIVLYLSFELVKRFLVY